MVYAAGLGVSHAELTAMDFAEYLEAEEARLIWQVEWNKK